jgi:hypothetical protein
MFASVQNVRAQSGIRIRKEGSMPDKIIEMELSEETIKEFKKIRDTDDVIIGIKPERKANVLLMRLMKLYRAFHRVCPECGETITYNTCSCKLSERI